MAFLHLSVLSVIVILCRAAKEENTTLLLVQTLSRHGDRAPSLLYPTDPNTADCWPNGLGQLTQLGKKQQYDVGVFLRSLYRDFVSPDPKQVFANSSWDDRCLDSALAQLASLYEPNERWKFTEDLDWQPIAVHYLPPKIDKYLSFQVDCPRAIQEFCAALQPNQESQKQQETVKELSKLSGLDYSNAYKAYNLFIAVESEMIHNCTVPEWVYEYFDEMNFVYDKVVQSFHSSPDQTKLRFGPFLGLINNNLKNKINGKTDLKFVLNFAHDVQVAGVLTALNFTDITHPPFCATLLFELHEMTDGSKTVRLRYMNTTYPLKDKEKQPVVLVLDGCSEFCPVDFFMESYQWLIPDNWEEECILDASDTSDACEGLF